MKYASVHILVFLLPTIICAQPQITLERWYDRAHTPNDLFADVYHCIGGDYLVCGQSSNQIWVMRLDPEGNPRWSYHEDGIRLLSIVEADNGDALTTGAWQGNLRVLRLDQRGGTVWERGYDGARGSAIIELKEGDFIVAGTIWTGANNQGCLLRIHGDGAAVWSHTYQGGQSSSSFWAMRETDGGVISAGMAEENNQNQGWIQKVDFNGDVIWSRRVQYNGGGGTSFRSLVSLPQGGFAAAGITGGDFVAYHFSSAGDPILLRRLQLEGGGEYTLYGMDKLSDGGLACVGYKMVGGNTFYPFMVRTDNQWTVMWTKDFADHVVNQSSNQFQAVIVLPGDVIVAAGSLFNRDDGSRQQDGYIVRMEPDNMFPMVFYRHPDDSLQTVLLGDSIQFVVRARDRLGHGFNYQWMFNREIVGADTTTTIRFDSLGVSPVSCRISNQTGAIEIGWLVTVTNLFIRSHTPDTLSLAVKRGHSVDFALDSVRAVAGDSISYAWTVTNLGNFQREELGRDAQTTIRFDHTGNFAVEGYAYRGEARDNVTWTVAVRSAILDYWPSSLSLTVPPDTVINFGVIPFNADSGAVHYEWRFDQDVLGADSSEVALNFGEIGDYEVGVVVRDSTDADTLVWRVNVNANANVNVKPPSSSSLSLSLSPNPFNSSTTVRFSVPGNGRAGTPILLTLHDITGRRIATLAEGQYAVGEHSVSLSGALTHSSTYALPAGVYLLRLETGGKVTVAKAVVVR